MDTGKPDKKVIRTEKIIVNGREYSSMEELPDEVKKLLEDKNNNGIPDIFEGKTDGEIIRMVQNKTFVNGKEIVNPDEIPEDVKKMAREFGMDYTDAVKIKKDDRIKQTTAVVDETSGKLQPVKSSGSPVSGLALILLGILIGLGIFLLLQNWDIIRGLFIKR